MDYRKAGGAIETIELIGQARKVGLVATARDFSAFMDFPSKVKFAELIKILRDNKLTYTIKSIKYTQQWNLLLKLMRWNAQLKMTTNKKYKQQLTALISSAEQRLT